MTDITPLLPRRAVPPLSVPLAPDAAPFRLADERPENFTLVVFYRGLHCPLCRVQLRDLESKLDAFAERGVGVIALSCDDAERAARVKAEWQLPRLRLGYGLTPEIARSWGLYLSAGHGSSNGVEEPELFSEPGLFLVRPNGELYFASVQTMPFARPPLADLLGGLDFVIPRHYPARGEVMSIADGQAAA